MTALRLTPMAAPISLQVMPAAKQLLSCSIRSDVHGLVDGIRDGEDGIGRTGSGAIEAVVTAAALASDGALSNGACMWNGLALLPRPYWAADRALVRAQRAEARLQNLEAKI